MEYLNEDKMDIIVSILFIGLVALFAFIKFKKANKKDCCK